MISQQASLNQSQPKLSDTELLYQILGKIEVTNEIIDQLCKAVNPLLDKLEPPKPTPQTKPTNEQETKINGLKNMLPQQVEEKLNFSIENGYIIIRTKQYLKEGFREVAQALKDAGAEYISAGKNTHWRKPL